MKVCCWTSPGWPICWAARPRSAEAIVHDLARLGLSSPRGRGRHDRRRLGRGTLRKGEAGGEGEVEKLVPTLRVGIRKFDLQFRFAICNPPSPFRLPPSSSFLPAKRPPSSPPLPIEALRLPAETVRLLHELGIAEHRPVGGVAAGRVFVAVRADAAAPLGPGDWAAGRAGAGLSAAAGGSRPIGRPSIRPPGGKRSKRRWGVWWAGWRQSWPAAAAGPCGWSAGWKVPPAGRDLAHLSGSRSARQAELPRLDGFGGAVPAHGCRGALFELVQLQLERLRIASPVSAIRVAATLTAPLEPPRQAMLFDESIRHTPCAGPHTACAATYDSAHGVCGITFGRTGGAAQQPAGTRRPCWACGCGPRPNRNWPGITTRWWESGGDVAGTRRVPAPHTACAGYKNCRRVRCGCCRGRGCSVVAQASRVRISRAARDACTTIAAAMVPAGRPGAPHRAQVGDRSGSKPAGGAAGRWAATISASKPPPAAAIWLFRRLRDGKWFLHGVFE